MNADQVRALVAAKWPDAMQSPVATACAAFATESAAMRLRADAMQHAEACLNACDGWTVETLGHNIESAFGSDLDADECDNIARDALKRFG